MLFEVRASPPFMKNGFVLGCDETREGVIIDPGDEIDELLEVVRDQRLTIKFILLTHAHVDHIVGVRAAKAATGAPIGLHPDDRPLYDRAMQQGLMFGLQVEPPPPVDFFYAVRGAEAVRQAAVRPAEDAHGREGASGSASQTGPFVFGRYDVRVHHTPGHAPGGVCLQVGRTDDPGRGKLLIVGDTLFAGSIGRTDLPGGSLEVLLHSIRTVLFPFGDDAIVWPGHGPETTIGHERRTNPFLSEPY